MSEPNVESSCPKPVLVRVSEAAASPKQIVRWASKISGSASGPVLVPVTGLDNKYPLSTRSRLGAVSKMGRTPVRHAVLPRSLAQRILEHRFFVLSAAGLAVGLAFAVASVVTVLRQDKIVPPGSQYSAANEYTISPTTLVSPQIVPAANDGAEGKSIARAATAPVGMTVSNVPVATDSQLLSQSGDPHRLLTAPVMDSSLDVQPPFLPVAASEHSADFVPATVLSANLSQPKLDLKGSEPTSSMDSGRGLKPEALILRPTQGTDKDAVLAALQKYSQAWTAKDVSDILALRPHLGRRTVKQELADVRSIAMRIRPIGIPKIEGNQAAVECIHEVSETFGDGIARQTPGTKMTYFLARGSAGTWQISDSR